MRGLKVLKSGPSMTLQDQGRPGFLGNGVSRGGAADMRALAEGAALLGQSADLAALEIAGVGGSFEVTGDVRIALTGAPMSAVVDDQPIAWNSSHQLRAGQVLEIGTALKGVYGYLHLGGGIKGKDTLGSIAIHLAAGLGSRTQEGDLLCAGPDRGTQTGLCLPLDQRFEGGEIRIVESFQSGLFTSETRARFAETVFHRGARANRMGVEICSEGAGFAARDQLNILSEVIVPGDVQMTGDGRPFVLMRESQTTGGYPRIGSVLPCDLNKVAQAGLGSPIRFKWIDLTAALEIERRHAKECQTLGAQCAPLRRDPADIPDLLSYQLIGGVISADQDPFS